MHRGRKKIIQVVGARPNFMKVAPVHQALGQMNGIDSFIVHTGQHQDVNMSEVFFKQLHLPEPKYFLGVKPGTHSQMTAQMMMAFEEVLNLESPDLVIVVGDVTSTLACALTSVRNSVTVAHVEAGLRSFDRQMPEEINRILTDQISDFLFTTEPGAREHLLKENIQDDKIHFTGNCMIDSLCQFLPTAQKLDISKRWGLGKSSFALMTMHRPTNVDTEEGLQRILGLIEKCLQHLPVIFPVHPRTRNRLSTLGLWSRLEAMSGLHVSEPLGYLEFISLLNDCKFILTDSGGIQEESTFLQIPCITFRKSTERPITVEVGSNRLIHDLNVETTANCIAHIMEGAQCHGTIPPLWDGKAGMRIAEIIAKSI